MQHCIHGTKKTSQAVPAPITLLGPVFSQHVQKLPSKFTPLNGHGLLLPNLGVTDSKSY